YGKIEEEVCVCQPHGFEDLDFPNKVYKVEKALYGLHQASRACQDKYVAEILKKFDFANVKTTSTLIEPNKALIKDEEAEEVDVHVYRSMIGSLMYLTASRPNIMFAVCACASDYAGASLDRKSITGGCQFLGKRLISWQCKKQTIVANSTTEAEYVAAANFYGQVLWIKNQMLDYGFNFMNTKIYIDNESTIFIVKNPVFHSKTKHIEIRHHFIRDSYEKKLIQVIKIHTDQNVADLLTKAFDVSSFNFLIASIGLLNLGILPGKTGQDTKIPQSGGPPKKVGDKVVHKELGDRMERAATTASSLEAEQDSDLEKAKDCSSKRDYCFERRGSRGLASEEKARPTGRSNLQILRYANKLMKLRKIYEELMLILECMDAEGDACRAKLMMKDEQTITLAQTLIQIKAAKPKVVTTVATTTTTTRPKAREVVVQEPSEFKAPQEAQPSISKDKGKCIMIEPKVPLKRKD
ncbi:putative reverse transcriptase, RNA-dependent DNA polymerase, partial [Tanacetum coccineum]